MEELDFGPISVVPPECCDGDMDFGDISEGDIEDTINTNPVRRNYTIIAYKEFNASRCVDRKFMVNMHEDNSWSFTFTNGEFLTQEQLDCYCKEIEAAQSYLETQQHWFDQGKGLGKWDFYDNPGGANGTGAHSTKPVYYPAGRSNDPFSEGPCSIAGPSAF